MIQLRWDLYTITTIYRMIRIGSRNGIFAVQIDGEMSSYQTQPNFYRYHLNICSLSHVQIKCQMVGPNNTALRH